MPRTATQAELLADPAIVPNNDVWTESDTAVMSANGLLFYYREGNGLLPYASLPVLGPSVAPGSCFPARPSVSRCPPACSVIASISIAELVECVEGLGRLPALQDAICEGTEECPTECEVIEGMDSSAIVACVPSGNRTNLLCALMQQPEITPEALVVCADGAGLTAALQALICAPVTIQLQDTASNPIGAADVYSPGTSTTKTAPDGQVNTTDGLTPVMSVLSNGSGNLPQAGILYKDVADADQEMAASDTLFSGGVLKATTRVPRFIVRTTDGLTDVVFGSAVVSSVNLPQSVIKYKDAADASQLLAASNTEYASSTLRPATEIPRRSINYVGGAPTGEYADAGALIGNTLPEIPIPATPSNIIREYIANDTWTHPSGLRWLAVVAVGAGGGAGGGRRNASNSTGGGAGGGGALVIRRIPAALLGSVGSTQTIIIGAGGAGGAASTGGSSNNGSDGGDTSFGSLVIAKGGSGGVGAAGAAATTSGGLASACTPARGPYAISGGGGPAGSNSTTVVTVLGLRGDNAAPAGGVGGGHNSGPTEVAGSDGGGVYEDGSLQAGPSGGSSPGSNGTNGTDDQSRALLLEFGSLTTYGIGTGGSGGAGSRTGGTDGGNGGNGGRCAGGGGGGSTNTTPASAGAGGNGGNGLLLLVEIY